MRDMGGVFRHVYEKSVRAGGRHEAFLLPSYRQPLCIPLGMLVFSTIYPSDWCSRFGVVVVKVAAKNRGRAFGSTAERGQLVSFQGGSE